MYRVLYNLVRRTPMINKSFHTLTQSPTTVQIPPYRWVYKKVVNYYANRYTQVPPHLEINVTNICNAHCVMCPPEVHRGKDIIPQALFEEIVSQAAAMGIKKLTLVGGEPLLDKKIYDKIIFAKMHGFRFIHMFTNGAALNEKNADELLQTGLDSLTFSIDSPFKEEFEQIRLGLSFNKVCENIVRFWELKQSWQQLNPLIRINMVEMSLNQQSKEVFIRKFSPYADIVEIIPAHNFGGNEDLADRDFTPDYLKNRSNHRFACNLFFSKIVIDARGYVKKCSIDYAAHATFGDTNTHPLEEIWKNQKFTSLRERMLKGQFNEPGCKGCNHIQSWWIDAYSEAD